MNLCHNKRGMIFAVAHPRHKEFKELTFQYLVKHDVSPVNIHVFTIASMADKFKALGVHVHVIEGDSICDGPFKGGMHMGSIRSQISRTFEEGAQIVELDDNINTIHFRKKPLSDFKKHLNDSFGLLKGTNRIFAMNPGALAGSSWVGSEDVQGLHNAYNGCVGWLNIHLNLVLPIREDLDRVMSLHNKGYSVLRRRAYQVIVTDISCWYTHLGYDENVHESLGKHIQQLIVQTHPTIFIRQTNGWGGYGFRSSAAVSGKARKKSTKSKKTQKLTRAKSCPGLKRSHHKKKTGAELAL